MDNNKRFKLGNEILQLQVSGLDLFQNLNRFHTQELMMKNKKLNTVLSLRILKKY